MKTLMINDLPQNDELDSPAMATITGGRLPERLETYILCCDLYTHGMLEEVPTY
jgi:hypothetical protein